MEATVASASLSLSASCVAYRRGWASVPAHATLGLETTTRLGAPLLGVGEGREAPGKHSRGVQAAVDGSDAHSQSEIEQLPIDLETKAADRLDETLCHALGLLQGDFLQHDSKLVPVQTDQKIVRAESALQALPDDEKRLLSRRAAQGVVDLIQVTHMKDQERAGRTRSGSTCRLLKVLV